jgi:hypothetical protein
MLAVPKIEQEPWCTYQVRIENMDRGILYCSHKLSKGKMRECPYMSKEVFELSEYKCLHYIEKER